MPFYHWCQLLVRFAIFDWSTDNWTEDLLYPISESDKTVGIVQITIKWSGILSSTLPRWVNSEKDVILDIGGFPPFDQFKFCCLITAVHLSYSPSYYPSALPHILSSLLLTFPKCLLLLLYKMPSSMRRKTKINERRLQRNVTRQNARSQSVTLLPEISFPVPQIFPGTGVSSTMVYTLKKYLTD